MKGVALPGQRKFDACFPRGSFSVSSPFLSKEEKQEFS